MVEGKEIEFCSVKDPAQLPWKALAVEVIVEITGKFWDKAACGKHILAGEKR